MEKSPKKTADEVVDGARIAARILNQYPAEKRKQLLAAIQTKDPASFSKIEANILAFDDVAQVSSRGIQLLMKEIDYNDLLLALFDAQPDIRSVFFQNMSERRLQVVRGDLEALKNVRPEDIDSARRRIVTKLDALRSAGAVQTVSGDDVWV